MIPMVYQFLKTISILCLLIATIATTSQCARRAPLVKPSVAKQEEIKQNVHLK